MALAAPDVDLFDYFRAMMLEGEIPALGDFTERPEWQPFGACWGTGPEVFFLSLGKNSAPAKALCRRCAVAEECLAYALADPELVGIWGGTSERERRAMRRVSA